MNLRKNKKMMYPFLITVVAAILMLMMVFLPYASANSEYKEILIKDSDAMYVREIGMTNSEAINISLLEFVKIYLETAKQDIQKEASIACIVIIVIFTVFALLTVFLSLIKKPIGIIVSDILALIAFKIIHFDFEDRGVIPSSSYNWGITNYLTYIIGIITIIGAVWMFIEKKRIKNWQKMNRIQFDLKINFMNWRKI